MSSDVKPPRAPDHRIARTERLLVAAAADLFAEQGYVATSLAQIAQRADVSPRTVYVRFGTKAALFHRVIGEALAGDNAAVDVRSRPRTQDTLTAPTLAERLDALADVVMGIVERAGPLLEVVDQAEGLEPEVAKAAQDGRRATVDLCVSIWTQAAADGLLPPDTDVETLAATTDLLVCADTIVHLRRTQAWPLAQHDRWLRHNLAALASGLEH